jgi:hypothetical protein
MALPADANVQGFVSGFLTQQGLSFSTQVLDESTRLWRIEFAWGEGRPGSFLVFVTTGQGLLSVSTYLARVDDSYDWRPDVWRLLETKDFPMVRLALYRDLQDTVVDSAFWLRADLPIDGNAPNMPVTPGGLFQAISAILLATRAFAAELPGKFAFGFPPALSVSSTAVVSRQQ